MKTGGRYVLAANAVALALTAAGVAWLTRSDQAAEIKTTTADPRSAPYDVLGHDAILEPIPTGPAGEGALEPKGPTPTAGPRTATLSDNSRLRLDGIEGLTWGMTLDEASAAAGVPIRIDPGTDLGRGCAFATPQGGPAGLSFMVINGRIVRADVHPVGREPSASLVSTLSGVRLGDSEDTVRETYGDRIHTELHPYAGHRGGHYLVYTPMGASAGRLSMIFETDGRRVTMFRSGLFDPVSAPEGCA